MTTAIPSHIEANSKKPRRFQFGLRAMLAIVAIVALFFLWYANFRSLKIPVKFWTYQVTAAELKAVLDQSKNSVSTNPSGSDYRQIVLADDELAKIPDPRLKYVKLSRLAHKFQVGARGTVRSLNPDGTGPHSVVGELEAYRRDGKERLRIMLNANCTTTSKSIGQDGTKFPKLVSSDDLLNEPLQIFYDGPVPKGNLVFFATPDEQTYHIIVFSPE